MFTNIWGRMAKTHGIRPCSPHKLKLMVRQWRIDDLIHLLTLFKFLCLVRLRESWREHSYRYYRYYHKCEPRNSESNVQKDLLARGSISGVICGVVMVLEMRESVGKHTSRHPRYCDSKSNVQKCFIARAFLFT